ncbi:MAG TPA: hypothetical protein VF121_06920 [Thermoanaerobaculia bacterium]|nr:hypothetical protein [Thermoanaerobaculia bacterium]
MHPKARNVHRVWLIVVFVLVSLGRGGNEAWAFKGKEHSGISETALATALEALSPGLASDELQQIRERFLDCPTKKVGKVDGSARCLPFGDLTNGPDLVFHAENLVQDPKSCLEGLRWTGERVPKRCEQPIEQCKPKVIRRLRGASDPDLEVFAAAGERLDAKARAVLNRLLAAHRNTSHFEACAAESYNRLHHLAIVQARERVGTRDDWWLVPLATEAVALHFLQDSFPPGHLLTPRTSTHDLLARGMHNRNNREGAEAFVDTTPSLAALSAALVQSSDARVRLEKQLGLTEPALVAASLAASGKLEFFGDGSLGSGHAEETLALVLTSARSITEVLAVGIDDTKMDPSAWKPQPGARTALEFTSWCGEPLSSSEDAPLDLDSLIRPGLQLRVQDDQGRVVERLAGYDRRPMAELDRWDGMRFEVGGGIMASTEGGSGRWVELASVGGFPGTADVQFCDENGNPTARSVKKSSQFVVAGNLRREDWGGEEGVWGASFLIYPWMKRLGWLHVDSYLGMELGVERYPFRDDTSDRFIWGARGGIGLGIVFVELGAERGYVPLAGDRLEKDTSFSLGARVQILY